MSTVEKEQPRYPKGERVWVGYHRLDGSLAFILTSKENSRDYYYLYSYHNGAFQKLGRGSSPKEIEARFHVDEILRSEAK